MFNFPVINTERYTPKGTESQSSGLLCLYDHHFLTIGDSENPPLISEFDFQILKKRLPVNTMEPTGFIKNIDRECLVIDDARNLYIGDFGNNLNNRQNLRIINFNPDTGALCFIHFKYEDQQQSPPRKMKNRYYNREAFILARGYHYMFSKNPGNKSVIIYSMPNQPGYVQLPPNDLSSLHIQATGANISPDQQTIVLVGYGKVLLIRSTFDRVNKFHLAPISCKPFRKSGQSEGIVFLDDYE